MKHCRLASAFQLSLWSTWDFTVSLQLCCEPGSVKRDKGGKRKEERRQEGVNDVRQTILLLPVWSSCPVCLSSLVLSGKKRQSMLADGETRAFTWMLGFCPLMSALERSGKLCRSRRKAPGPSLCTLPPCAQGRVAGRWASRCSGPDRRSWGASWAEELLFAFMLFCWRQKGGQC